VLTNAVTCAMKNAAPPRPHPTSSISFPGSRDSFFSTSCCYACTHAHTHTHTHLRASARMSLVSHFHMPMLFMYADIVCCRPVKFGTMTLHGRGRFSVVERPNTQNGGAREQIFYVRYTRAIWRKPFALELSCSEL